MKQNVALHDSTQFSERKAMTDSIILKIAKDINKELLAMKKKTELVKIPTIALGQQVDNPPEFMAWPKNTKMTHH